MRKAILIVGAFGLATFSVTAQASAAPPIHERFEFSGTFDPGNPDEDLSFGVPEICDFDYVQSWYGIANVTTWGDPEDFDRQIWTGPVVVTHTNATTGYVLVEKASYAIIAKDNWATSVNAGLMWHLRDPVTGKLMLVQAGMVVYDGEDAVKYTPSVDPDFWNVVCRALGGDVLPGS